MKVPSTQVSQTSLEGMHRAREQAASAARRIVEGPIEAEDIVSLNLAEHAFKANAAVLGTEKRMQERLLDIFA